MKDYKSVVAQRIKTARKDAGFRTQEALADALDIDQSRVARWEKGHNLPTGTYRANLLKALGKSFEEIFGHAEPNEPPSISAQLEAVAERAAEKVLSRKVPGLSPVKQSLVDLIVSGSVTEARARVLLDALSVESASVAPDEVEPATPAKRR